jgi:hypothetical protein
MSYLFEKICFQEKICIIFIKNSKFKKTQKKTFVVRFFRWVFWFFFWCFFLFFIANPEKRRGGDGVRE